MADDTTTAIPAYCDVPLCAPPCRGPLVTRAEHHRGGEYRPGVRLVCLNCGDGFEGTDAQVAQAERARDAWAAEKATWVRAPYANQADADLLEAQIAAGTYVPPEPDRPCVRCGETAWECLYDACEHCGDPAGCSECKGPAPGDPCCEANARERDDAGEVRAHRRDEGSEDPVTTPLTSADLADVAKRASWHWFTTALRKRLDDGDRERWKDRFVARAVSLAAYWHRRDRGLRVAVEVAKAEIVKAIEAEYVLRDEAHDTRTATRHSGKAIGLGEAETILRDALASKTTRTP